MNMNPTPDWSHDRRTRLGLRGFCDGVAWLVSVGHIDADTAGRRLERLGIPFDAQCRVVRDALTVRELCPEPEDFLELETTA